MPLHSEDYTVPQIWMLTTDQEQLQILSADGKIACNPDGTLIATGGWSGIVQVWETTTGQCIAKLKCHEDIKAICFIADNVLTIGSKGGIISYWAKVSTPQGDVWQLDWSNDKRFNCGGANFQGAKGLTRQQQTFLRQHNAAEFKAVEADAETAQPAQKKPSPNFFKSPIAYIPFLQKKLTQQLPEQHAPQLPRTKITVEKLLQLLQKNPIPNDFLDLLTQYLQSNDNSNMQNKKTNSLLLSKVIRHELLDAAKLLLKVGADQNFVDVQKTTPLHNAIAHGQLEMAQLLLDNGALANAKDIHGKTPRDYWLVSMDITHKEFKELLQRRATEADAWQIESANIAYKLREKVLQLFQAGDLPAIEQCILELQQQLNTLYPDQDIRIMLERLIANLKNLQQHPEKFNVRPKPKTDEDYSLEFQRSLKKLIGKPDPYLSLIIYLRDLRSSANFNALTLEQKTAVVAIENYLLPAHTVTVEFNADDEKIYWSEQNLHPLTLLQWPKDEQKKKQFKQQLLQEKNPIVLSVNDALFAQLNKRIAVIEAALKTLQATPSKQQTVELTRLLQNLEMIVQLDQDYRAALCKPDAASKQNCLEPHFSLMTESFSGVLPTELTNKLGKRENDTGKHDVVGYGGLHFKPRPDAPGTERMVGVFSQLLGIGSATPTELVQVLEQTTEGGKRWPLLISKRWADFILVMALVVIIAIQSYATAINNKAIYLLSRIISWI